MMRIHSVQAIAHIQDLGRFGLRRFGIGHAGAMDTLALQAGNLLLGNETGAAALEIALGGISVSFTRDTPFCLTGAIYEAALEEQPVYSYWRYTARRGQTLTLKRAVQGMYGYLCVAGGFDVPEILGARSTDLKAAFGGFQGHCLQAGDEVPLGAGARSLSHIGVAPITPATSIRALPSSEYAAFGLDAQRALWQQPWVLQSNSNRMGYRFSGETLALAQPRSKSRWAASAYRLRATRLSASPAPFTKPRLKSNPCIPIGATPHGAAKRSRSSAPFRACMAIYAWPAAVMCPKFWARAAPI